MAHKKSKKKNIFPFVMLGAAGTVTVIIVIAIFVFMSQNGGNGSDMEVATGAPEATMVADKTTESGETFTELGEKIEIIIPTETTEEPTETETETEADTEATTEAETTTEAVAAPAVDFYPGGLPVIYINTEGNKGINSKYSYVNAVFSMDSRGIPGFDNVSNAGIRIRGRGWSTWNYFPKKNYKINFNEKISLIGKSKDKDWVLIGNFHDRSLSRNELCMKLAKTLSHIEFTPDMYPVDVVLNGEYLGVYDLCEQIEVAGGRVEINKNEAAVDSGFLVEVGGDYSISAGMLKCVEIKYPKTPTGDQKSYIANYLRTVNDIIVKGADINALSQYVDIDNFVDWLLLMEFTYNFDSGFERNVFMYKEPGGKLKLGPVWDFDLALGGVFYNDLEYQNWATSYNGLVGASWSTYLFENPVFLELMKNRWLQVKSTLIQTADNTLNGLYACIGDSYEKNYQRWMLPYEGQNLKWECELEYKLRHLGEMQNYVRRIVNYRVRFLDRALLEGYKPKKEEKITEKPAEVTTTEASEAVEEKSEEIDEGAENEAPEVQNEEIGE